MTTEDTKEINRRAQDDKLDMDDNITRAIAATTRFSNGVAPACFMWMPGGVSVVHASYTGVIRGKRYDQFPVEKHVECEPTAVERLNQWYASMRARWPKRQPYGCFEHNRTNASMHPADENPFQWGAAKEYGDAGIYVRGEWSAAGLQAVRAKRTGEEITQQPGGQPPENKEPVMDPKDTAVVDQLTAENKSLKESAETVRAHNKQLRETILASGITRAKERGALLPKADDTDAHVVRARKIAAEVRCIWNSEIAPAIATHATSSGGTIFR
jgi:hypothetical protein